MKNLQKGFIVPLLIVIIALLLAGGGAYVYMQQKSANQSATGNSATQTSNSQTANWETYTDNQHGFEIKYPLSWESPFKGWAPGWTAGESLDNSNYCVIDASFSGASPQNNGEISDLLGKGYIQTSIKIGGVNGIRLTGNPSKAGLTETVYFSYKCNDFRIGRNRGTGDKIENECISTFNQVLSTLKFLQ
ncbi:MAG: PsbP-related protein [Candidatus Kaiserbacteria bacterium]|nr:PsbP-related protein [Candidatus Kaiserbacteria bacterium]